MKKWLLCAWILGLFGCDGSVEGDVFIIKGSGDIAVSPGRTVTFIPGVSERTLFGQAASYAGEVALASIQDDLVAICPVAKASSDATLSGLAEEINAIKAKGSIPLEGCGKIEATSARLALEAGSEKERQTSETTRLSKNVASARSEKNRRVKEIAAGLKNEQMKRLTVTYRSNGEYSAWTFTNNSDFCIGDADGYSFYFAADGFSNGIKTISAVDSKYSSSKDVYGFEMEGCFLPAGQSYTYSILYGAPTTATPENRKAASEGKVRTYDCGPSYSRKVCIEVDSARWTSSYEFLEISRDDNGDSVVYSVTPVDWESKGLSVEDFDAYDSRIQDAEDALARAKKRYSASSLLADADAAKNSAAECRSDEKKLSTLEPAFFGGKKVDNSISCDRAQSPTELAAGLTRLNSELQLELDIPDIKEPYQEAFLSNFLSAVSSEGVVTADTSIQGHYSIDALTPGNYLVMAEYQDNFVEGFWLDAVTISRGEQVIDLNQNTFVNVPLIEYLRQASACDECLGNDSIPARRFLVEAGKKAIEERERVLKELEDTFEEVERAMRRLRGG